MLPATNLDTLNNHPNSNQNEFNIKIDNQTVSLEESRIEPETRLDRVCRSIKSGCSNCWGCMAEFFSKSYEYLSEFFASVVDWLNENLCCLQKEEEDSLSRANARKKIVAKKPPPAKLESPKPFRAVKESSLVKECLPTKEAYIAKETSPPRSNSPSASPALSQTQLNVPSVSSTSRSPLQLPTFNSARTVSENREPSSPPVREPPKIHFETTGSIFGDRKRSTIDHNMLQIENGRYRSPGTSKTIYGPGGRVIRVSFVSGFPAFKSNESRNSPSLTGSRISLKKSTETIQQNDKAIDPFMRKLKSVKSNRSLNSSSEGPKEEETQREQL